jgi:hypothetical protein
MAADCTIEKSGHVSRQGQEMFLFPTPSILALGLVWPPFQLVTGVLSPRVKRPVREAGR